MNEDDYILLFDQNGSPYIAHASLSGIRQRASGALRTARSAVGSAAGTVKQGVGRGVRTTHKYIQKIEANGRTRYFYTQEELKAYLAEKKTQAQDTANKAKEKARAGIGEAQERAAHTRAKAERLSNEFKNKPSQLGNKIKDKLGYDERERRDAAKTAYEEAKKFSESAHRSLSNAMNESPVPWKRTEEEKKRINNLTKLRSDMYAEQDKKFKEYLNTQSDYDSTFLGKADSVKNALKDAKNDADVAMYHAEEKIKKAAGNVKKAAEDAAFEVEYAAKQAINNVTGNKDAAERDFYLAAAQEARKEAANHGPNAQSYYAYVIGELEKKAEAADKRYQSSAVGKAKNTVKEVSSKISDAAENIGNAVRERLKDHNGSPSNSSTETRSMLGSYATEIPSAPDKLKEWADKGKQQAQQVIKEAEDALKEIEQGYENGEYTQYQLWTAQNIVEGMQEEMSEWEFLSSMSGEELGNLFGPLLNAKKK